MTTSSAAVRSLIALNGDIVGYSKLMADDFEATSQMVERYERLIADKVREAQGTLVNFVGDNFMAVFEDAKDAMHAAIAITTAIEEINQDIPSQRRVRFRLGMDEGEVAASEDQYYGEALNIAARIQAIAPPGGLSVSGKVYRSLDEPALRFRPTGSQQLKNIPERVEVYRFTELPSEGESGLARSQLALETPAIAVFPIHTESVSPDVASAARMIREEIVHRLAGIPDLKVVDSSGEVERNRTDRAVPFLIETGAHQLGSKVRIYAKLIDAFTVNVMWSNRWDADTDDLFDLIDQVSDAVARAVEVELVIGEPARIYNELDDPEAIQQIYLGWYHLTSNTKEGWRKATDLFESVALSHPDKAVGHSLAAFSNWSGASLGYTDPEAGLAKAFEQAARGVELGDPTGLSITVQAAILLSRGHHDEALEMVNSTEISRPTCDITFGLQGSVHRYMGEWEKSLEKVETAMSLTPVVKPWYPTIQACDYFMADKLERAAATAEAVLEYQANNLEALLVLAAVQVRLGLERRARATASKIREEFPLVDVGEWLDKNPYKDEAMLSAWRDDLAQIGLIEAPA